MTNDKTNAPQGVSSAALRLSEIEGLYQTLRDRVKDLTDQLGQPTGDTPKNVLNKIDQLTAAHLQLVIAEERFHEKLGQTADDDAIDYDAIRADIGGRVDRIRDSFAVGRICGQLPHIPAQAASAIWHRYPDVGRVPTPVIRAGRSSLSGCA